MFVCLICFGALGLEALTYVYWEKPSLGILKAGEGLTGVYIGTRGNCSSFFAVDFGHVFELGVQC